MVRIWRGWVCNARKSGKWDSTGNQKSDQIFKKKKQQRLSENGTRSVSRSRWKALAHTQRLMPLLMFASTCPPFLLSVCLSVSVGYKLNLGVGFSWNNITEVIWEQLSHNKGHSAPVKAKERCKEILISPFSGFINNQLNQLFNLHSSQPNQIDLS